MIEVGRILDLSRDQRHLLSIRSTITQSYRSIIIYSTTSTDCQHNQQLECSEILRWFAMEEECPHLGASMVNAELEIEGDDLIAICPWHSYDFNLKTGESSVGLKACVYETFLEDGRLYIDYPDGTTDWEIVSIRPISQRFAIEDLDPEELESSIKSSLTQMNLMTLEKPRDLIEFGGLILRTSDPDQKVHLTRHAVDQFRRGKLKINSSSPTCTTNETEPEGQRTGSLLSTAPDQPTRQDSIEVLRPNQIDQKRGKASSLKNRIRLLHSLANIELWAIDLAWDLIVRFGKTNINGKSLPRAFFNDFCKVAEDESKHFTLLREALNRLGSGWGQLPVHDGLWQSARDTSHSLVSRLCIIHLVHEARGLDVNPNQIKKVRDAGDYETASSLEIIHSDEVTHVAAGHRWLCYICEESQPRLDPIKVFREQVKEHFIGNLKPPFNIEDRARAGLDLNFYHDL
ncbi:hypothetical protein PPACK8108_LOCUS1852 [Phakopsora pachyrhizi]|uniref:Rieske domain-containing protein n=1 Tax=Phakopsora pachyrhizi TaxID=170000 RepID=A0AAV0AIZ6_PHAPC|nr:hypothetical protein PPACK8108_LOCUS1852 [Phakopsora pachyrhizi]